TLTKWEMINPHSWFHLDVKDDGGTVVPWMIEGGSPNQLIKNGVTKNTLVIGTELIIEGYQAKDGANKGVGRNLLLADGRRLFLGSTETDKWFAGAAAVDAPAPSFAVRRFLTVSRRRSLWTEARRTPASAAS